MQPAVFNDNTAPDVCSEVRPANIISVADKSITEGDGGYKFMLFDVKPDKKPSKTVTVKYSIQSGTAKKGSNFIAKSNVLIFRRML